MKNIDWSKAPEGATHATKECSSWYRNNNGTWYFYHESNRGWVLSECSEEWREVHLIARPAVVAWRGPQDGLPPVGTVFEFSLTGHAWDRRVMLFSDEFTCLMAHPQNLASRWHYKSSDPAMQFRPVPSEREMVIDEMVADVKQAFCAQVYGGEVSKIVAEALYDAGYRKGGK